MMMMIMNVHKLIFVFPFLDRSSKADFSDLIKGLSTASLAPMPKKESLVSGGVMESTSFVTSPLKLSTLLSVRLAL